MKHNVIKHTIEELLEKIEDSYYSDTYSILEDVTESLEFIMTLLEDEYEQD